jgi:LysM repeat protein
MFRLMKQICLVLLTSISVGCAVLPARAQDAALEQRLNELSGRIETLLEGQETQRKQISELVREVNNLREHANRPLPTYASQEDLKRLADALRDVDRKRLEDYDKIRAELQKLGRLIKESAPAVPAAPPPSARDNPKDEKPAAPETGFDYVVQEGDTLSGIVSAYRAKGVKTTSSQILKANPGLRADRIIVGKKIFIPEPKQ